MKFVSTVARIAAATIDAAATAEETCAELLGGLIPISYC